MIDYSKSAFPKPEKKQDDAVIIYPDGREECYRAAGRREYKRRTKLIWKLCCEVCVLCFRVVDEDEVTADHVKPRGNGGMNRDDRIGIGILPAHPRCNYDKGSKRVKGLYQRAMKLIGYALAKDGYLSTEERVIAEELVGKLQAAAQEEETESGQARD